MECVLSKIIPKFARYVKSNGMALISNNEIKRIKSLQQKKFRDETGLFVVEGEKLVEEALNSHFEVEAVYRRDEIGEEAMKKMNASSALIVGLRGIGVEIGKANIYSMIYSEKYHSCWSEDDHPL